MLLVMTMFLLEEMINYYLFVVQLLKFTKSKYCSTLKNKNYLKCKIKQNKKTPHVLKDSYEVVINCFWITDAFKNQVKALSFVSKVLIYEQTIIL